MIQLSATLATTTKGIFTAALTLTDETIITLDVEFKSGSHNDSRITLEHSPDNINWFSELHSTNGTGSLTVQLAANYVRACVLRGEGKSSAANITITAK